MSFVVGPWECFGLEIIKGLSSFLVANKESFKLSKTQTFTQGTILFIIFIKIKFF